MASISIALVFILMFSLGASAPLTCPNVEDLNPCSCKRVAYGLHVVCANFNDSSKLLKAFRILRDFRVHNVLLHGLYLTDVLPSDLFDGMQISEIRVEKCKLKFSQPAFTGLDTSLHILNVAQNSMIKSSEGFSLARLTKLTELNIKSNPLGKVENRLLNGKVPNVNKIILDEDEISEVENNAFANLPQLKTISMADNRIKSFSRSMLPRPALVLTRIDLSNNEIKELPPDMFFDMPSLKEIALAGNDLKTLPENTWKPVWEQLSQVLLIENKLECDEALDWIKRFRKPYQLMGDCIAPQHMIGRPIKDIYNT